MYIIKDCKGGSLCPPQNILTPIGREIENSIKFINDKYLGVVIDKYIIMPNHIHMIVILDNSGGHGNPPLQNVIGQLKSYTQNKFEDILWQRSFHDHIIRDETDYLKIRKDIDENPLKWEEDCFYIS